MDQVRFYRDEGGDWRWRRIDLGNHKEVGASSEGYENKADMVENAVRLNGPESESLQYIELFRDDGDD